MPREPQKKEQLNKFATDEVSRICQQTGRGRTVVEAELARRKPKLSRRKPVEAPPVEVEVSPIEPEGGIVE